MSVGHAVAALSATLFAIACAAGAPTLAAGFSARRSRLIASVLVVMAATNVLCARSRPASGTRPSSPVECWRRVQP